MATTPIVINSVSDLQAIQNDMSGYYVLGADIDAAGLSFVSIGSATNPFTGTFDGQGHTISNLTINNVTDPDTGLFGYVGATGVIINVGLIDETTTSSHVYVGGLAGENFGTIARCYVSGTVSGVNYVGALVGLNGTSGSITQSYATGTADGQLDVGGLVGVNQGTIIETYATGTTNPSGRPGVAIGGLAGLNTGSITQSYAIGTVGLGGGFGLGGLIGSGVGTIAASYWDTETTGRSTSAGGTGLTTAQLESGILPDGFDPTIWIDVAGQSPALRWQTAAPLENHAPVASNVTANANEDTNDPIVKLVASFTDADLSDTFTFSIDPTGMVGKVINNNDRTFTYDPNGKFEYLSVGETAADSFTYSVTDNHGASSTATATVTIHGENDAPSARADVAVVEKGASVTADAANGVLVNDSDTDRHDILHVSSVNGLSANVGRVAIGSYGSLTLSPDGSYSYSANRNIPGLTNNGDVQDTFLYTVDDGHGGTASSTLTVTVQTQNALSSGPVFSIRPLDADKNEGNSGATPFTFVVTRDGNASGAARVDWKVGPANAVTADGLDFVGGTFPAGTVTFGVGEFSKTITVNVEGDTFYESSGKAENFVVTLSNPSAGATIRPTQDSAVGHIHNDDLPLQDAAKIFAALGTEGEIVALAQLAQAAYHLVPSIEKPGAGINNPDGIADYYYAALPAGMQVLTASELPSISPQSVAGDLNFPNFGLLDGIYINGNAAALVIRSADSLFIAFRGTNDSPNIVQDVAGGLSGHGGTPDSNDWSVFGGMPHHYDLLQPLVTAIDHYLSIHADISHVYVTGHSLGASMAQRFMSDDILDNHAQVSFQAVTFANPGFDFSISLDDPRIVNIDILGDPVLGLSPYAVRGDMYQIVDNDFSWGGRSLHDMSLYLDAVRFLNSQHDSVPQSDLNANGTRDLVNFYTNIKYTGDTSDPWSVTLATGVVPSPQLLQLVPNVNLNHRDVIGVTGGGTLTGGPQNDVFTFAPGFGPVTVTDFRPGQDTIQIDPSLFRNAKAVMAHAHDVNGDVVIAYDANDTITLLDVTKSQLHLTDFQIV
ncbi:Ig-like domain-containing protein [Bradyrhizobium sp. WSM1743]|uniref:Ig-like domain-containing protein n=1 Tax=Bradyrhizobium sp. WSM1743 TaxID=318996 RepID=UPI00040FFDE3|nr:Ig-like domain-containing protein [Bradyrhizobium sp. WSM1743]